MPPDENVPEADFNAGLAPAQRSRLVVFGGSFDPVHNGHLQLAKKILEHGLGDEVLFVPAKHSPLKNSEPFATGEQRMKMLNLAIEDALREKPYFETTNLDGEVSRHDYRISTSDLELQRSGSKSYTIDTLETLKRAYPGTLIAFAMGTDCLAELKSWHRYGELLRQYEFIIYPRPGEFLQLLRAPQPTGRRNDADPIVLRLAEIYGVAFANKLRRAMLTIDEFPMLDLSSTDIRRAVAAGGDPSAYLSPSVWKFIQSEKLYQ